MKSPVYLFINLVIKPLSSIYSSIYRLTPLFIYQPIHLLIHLAINIFSHLSPIYISINPSSITYRSIYLSFITQSIYNISIMQSNPYIASNISLIKSSIYISIKRSVIYKVINLPLTCL